MERVKTLIKKLQEKLENDSSVEELLNIVNLLQSELISAQENIGESLNIPDGVCVITPVQVMTIKQVVTAGEEPKIESREEQDPIENIVEEKPVEEEHALQLRSLIFEEPSPEEEEKTTGEYTPIVPIPTLFQQDEEPAPAPIKVQQGSFEFPEESPRQDEINDTLKQSQTELGDKLKDSPIKDLRKAIGVNDQYLFINELFHGDDSTYRQSIRTIQNFSILPEAEYWIRRELKVKLGWDKDDPLVKQFDSLVKRRFS